MPFEIRNEGYKRDRNHKSIAAGDDEECSWTITKKRQRLEEFDRAIEWSEREIKINRKRERERERGRYFRAT